MEILKVTIGKFGNNLILFELNKDQYELVFGEDIKCYIVNKTGKDSMEIYWN